MRLLVVLGTSAGGVGRHVHGLVRSLTGAGHHVVVACPPDVEAHFAFADVAAAVVPLDVSDRPHPARDTRAVRDLARLAGGADLVHAHGLRAAALAVLATARSGVPVVATLHNAAPSGALTGVVYAGLERGRRPGERARARGLGGPRRPDGPARRPPHRAGRRRRPAAP